MGVALEHTGHALIVFDDMSYRWVSVKRFVWDAPCAGIRDWRLTKESPTPIMRLTRGCFVL
jgi:hypothetical protein